MTAKIKIREARVYGVLRYYPECAMSKAILAINKNAKTFSNENVKTLRQGGFDIVLKDEAGAVIEYPSTPSYL